MYHKITLKNRRLLKQQQIITNEKNNDKLLFKTSVENFHKKNTKISFLDSQKSSSITSSNASSKSDHILVKPTVDFLAKYKKEHKYEIEENFNMNTIEQFLEHKSKIDSETAQLIDYIKSLENKEVELKENLGKMKKKELDRLFKEILKNDYERRFNTSSHVVISAMIGEENTLTELYRQTREQKIYYDKLKMCRIYNPSDTRLFSGLNRDLVNKNFETEGNANMLKTLPELSSYYAITN